MDSVDADFEDFDGSRIVVVGLGLAGSDLIDRLRVTCKHEVWTVAFDTDQILSD